MEERLRFVARLLEGEAMAALCREFCISRKTGYKIFERYKEHGQEALNDRSRRVSSPFWWSKSVSAGARPDVHDRGLPLDTGNNPCEKGANWNLSAQARLFKTDYQKAIRLQRAAEG